MNVDGVAIEDPMTDAEMLCRVYQRQSEILERMTVVETLLTKIHTVMDTAFNKFEALAKSPILGSLLGGSKRGG